MVRTGFGYDIHALREGRKLVLGGVEIPFRLGLEGHSDADALCHAIMDALLGAAAMGDIGDHFPDTDPQYAGISSISLLKRVKDIVRAHNWKVRNIDATIVAQEPRLQPYKEAMRANIAAALYIPIDDVSVKAATNEGFDAAGRVEAMKVFAVATLVRAQAE
ncbi:2-C-methyl-D-erythritol 2,4-cyclodiphosphate synthase [bacterium]|nr:2-C-methyl-D-erythritol 2,4-cyclodiphosphate synthase [bacterium]